MYKASKKLIEAVKRFEGFRRKAYRDSAGVLTIGYGHTGDVMPGTIISESQAEEYLRHDLDVAGRAVNKLGVCKSQGQFDALCDFAFNLGAAALSSSTLLKKIRAKAPTEQIQNEFRRWVYAGGRKLQGLVYRREWEATTYANINDEC